MPTNIRKLLPHRVCWRTWFACVVGVFVLFVSTSNAQVMKAEAQLALNQPSQVDVAPLTQSAKVGTAIPIEIVLRDGSGNPVNAAQDTEIELSVADSSGKTTQSKVTIPKGQKSIQTTVVVENQGLAKLSVRHARDQLLAGTNWVKVLHPTLQKVPSQRRRRSSGQATTRPTSLNYSYETPVLATASFKPRQPLRLVFTALQNDGPVSNTPTGNSEQPYLMFRVSGENDAQGIRADGKSFARIQVFYMGPTDPTRDIRVWLSWSNGEIDNNPLIIRRGESMGEAHWTSKSPIESATVAAVATEPHNLKFQGEKQTHVRFAEPILGIAFINAPTQISIIDTADLDVGFYNDEGIPTQTSTKRPYHFTSSNPMIRLNPREDSVLPGKTGFTTNVLATSLGTAVIEASVPGYKPTQLKLNVSGTSVLILCIVGGLFGGWLGYVKSDGKLGARMVAGVLVGLLATWVYVYIGVPNTNAAILHNQISALFVSLLAAVAGVKIVAGIGKLVGLAF